jgi:hypothetical protein
MIEFTIDDNEATGLAVTDFYLISTVESGHTTAIMSDIDEDVVVFNVCYFSNPAHRCGKNLMAIGQ